MTLGEILAPRIPETHCLNTADSRNTLVQLVRFLRSNPRLDHDVMPQRDETHYNNFVTRIRDANVAAANPLWNPAPEGEIEADLTPQNAVLILLWVASESIYNNPNRSENRLGEATVPQSVLTLLLEGNRRRDELMERMFNELSLSRNNALSGQNATSTSTPVYRIMPDLSKDISDFDGEGDSTKARNWLSQIRSMRELHQWPESFVLETSRIHLKGAA